YTSVHRAGCDGGRGARQWSGNGAVRVFIRAESADGAVWRDDQEHDESKFGPARGEDCQGRAEGPEAGLARETACGKMLRVTTQAVHAAADVPAIAQLASRAANSAGAAAAASISWSMRPMQTA